MTLWVSSMGLRWRNGLLKAWWVSKQRSSICLLASYIPCIWIPTPLDMVCILGFQDSASSLTATMCQSEKRKGARRWYSGFGLWKSTLSLAFDGGRRKEILIHVYISCLKWCTVITDIFVCSPALVVAFLEGRIPIFCEGKGCISLIERGPLEPSDHIKEAQKQSP